MKEKPLRYLLSLICLLTVSMGCQTEEQKDRKEILLLFQQYKEALHSPQSAEKLYPLLSGMYLSDFKINIDLALHENAKMMHFLPFPQKAMVLTMRHKVPLDVLTSGNALDVLTSLQKDVISFLPEDTPLSELRFGPNNTAIGIYNTSLYAKSMKFYKHPKTGIWKLDPRGDFNIQETEVKKLLEENEVNGRSEEDLLKTIIFGASASPDSVLKWEPLVLGRK